MLVFYTRKKWQQTFRGKRVEPLDTEEIEALHGPPPHPSPVWLRGRRIFEDLISQKQIWVKILGEPLGKKVIRTLLSCELLVFQMLLTEFIIPCGLLFYFGRRVCVHTHVYLSNFKNTHSRHIGQICTCFPSNHKAFLLHYYHFSLLFYYLVRISRI